MFKDNAAKNFNFSPTSLSVLYNYFDAPKLFLDSYPAKFLDTSAKSFSSRAYVKSIITEIVCGYYAENK